MFKTHSPIVERKNLIKCMTSFVTQIIQGRGIYRMNKSIKIYQKMVEDYGPNDILHLMYVKSS